MTADIIYKILTEKEWRDAEAEGAFSGSAVDQADGFIHFSTAAQVAETARRHFAGQDGLILLSVDAGELGATLKWEPSRDGDLFPHLYQKLVFEAVIDAMPLPLAPDGGHVFPDHL